VFTIQDNNKIDPRNHFKSNEEFNDFMEKIDLKLKAKDVPIVARQIQGAREVAKTLKTNIYIAPKFSAKPSDFRNFSLSEHVYLWFLRRYGDRLKMNLSFGKTIVSINHDFYEVKLPFVWGHPQYVFDITLKDYPNFQDPRCNVARLVEGLTPDLARKIDKSGQFHILNKVIKGIHLGQMMEQYIEIFFIKEAKGDLIQSVDSLFQHKPLCGLSKWGSLQFTEKIIKSFLKNKKESFPKTHNLSELINLLVKYNIKNLDFIDINHIQCSPDVRYNSELVKFSEAVQAHWDSIDLGLIILQQF
jgi:HEPN domain-containing protein